MMMGKKNVMDFSAKLIMIEMKKNKKKYKKFSTISKNTERVTMVPDLDLLLVLLKIVSKPQQKEELL